MILIKIYMINNCTCRNAIGACLRYCQGSVADSSAAIWYVVFFFTIQTAPAVQILDHLVLITAGNAVGVWCSMIAVQSWSVDDHAGFVNYHCRFTHIYFVSTVCFFKSIQQASNVKGCTAGALKNLTLRRRFIFKKHVRISIQNLRGFTKF